MTPTIDFRAADRQLHRYVGLRRRVLVAPPDDVGVHAVRLQDVCARGRPLLHLADETRDTAVTQGHQTTIHCHIQRHRNGDTRTSGSFIAVHRGRWDEIRCRCAGDLVHADDHGDAVVSAQGETIRPWY